MHPLVSQEYVYAHETGLYYLCTRYYDPEICRFINADILISTGQGILGNNMFAYCGNNPVSRVDPLGRNWLTDSWIAVRNFVEDTYEYITNSDVETARNNLKKDGFTFYKSVPVFSVSGLGTGGASFGGILLGSGNLDSLEFAETLNHEYGHIRHYTMVGFGDYLVNTAIPSIAFAGLTKVGVYSYDHYHDLPWERTADYLGGVDRGYLPATNTIASIYWIYTLVQSVISPF